jgi:ATP-binding cassette, subfamily B (MDR/TAP), member 1
MCFVFDFSAPQYMWQFALLAIGCIPVMAFVASMRMKQALGTDEKKDVSGNNESDVDKVDTPGAILVETLANIRTIASLTLERTRLNDFEKAIEQSEQNLQYNAFVTGLVGGSHVALMQYVNALQFWFGGWLLYNMQDEYTFRDFLIANFSLLLSLFGLGSAFQDVSDRKEVEKSASRLFYLLDRCSSIDPLSTDGKKLV